MSDIVAKIRQLIETVPRQDGIIGLIRLQAECSDSTKYKCRVACLHLMEMEHDWQGIRKLMVEWNLVKTFGRELAIRMRKRVGEEPGSISDDPDIILKQLDRTNDKNWRQYSPKKNFPDYAQYLNDAQKQDNKSISNTNTFRSDLTKQSKQSIPQQPQEKKQRFSIMSGGEPRGGIFSKLVEFQKQEKEKEREKGKGKDIQFKGIFSKQLPKTDSGNLPVQNKQKAESQKELPKPEVKIVEPEPNKNDESTYSAFKFNSLKKKGQPSSRPTTPSKQSKKVVVTMKYGNPVPNNLLNSKIKQDFREQFSFSAVKARQVQAASLKKNPSRQQKQQNLSQQLDNSFMNFTNQSLNKSKSNIKKDEKQGISFGPKKQKILEQQTFQQYQERRSATRIPPNKPLFNQQQLRLISTEVPPVNYVKQILQLEGNSGIQMLKNRLKL